MNKFKPSLDFFVALFIVFLVFVHRLGIVLLVGGIYLLIRSFRLKTDNTNAKIWLLIISLILILFGCVFLIGNYIFKDFHGII